MDEPLEAPSSTIALFNTILRNAESENDGSEQGRTRLFHIATKLAKMNLKEEAKSSNSSSNVVANDTAIWEVIVNFLQKYQDYALYRPPAERPKAGSASNGQQNGSHEGEQEEEMAVCFLPQMLRKLALLGTPPTKLSVANAKRYEKLRLSMEECIARVANTLHTQFYRAGEDGVDKHREYLSELSIALEALSSQAGTVYPRRLALFKGTNSDNEDVFTENNSREIRPFFVSLQTAAEGSALQLSLLRIMVKSITLSTTWSTDCVTRIVEALIGHPSDWGLQSDKKGKGKATSSQSVLARLQLVERLFDCSHASMISSPSRSAVSNRVLEVYATRLTPSEVTTPEATSPPAEDTEIDQQLCSTLAAVLASTAEDPFLSNQLARFVKDHSHELVQRLVEPCPNLANDANGEASDLTCTKTSILLLLAARISNDSQGRNSGQCLAKQLSPRDQDDLRRWLQKTSLHTPNAASKIRAVVLQQKRVQVLAALPSHPRKRTLDAIGDIQVQNGTVSIQSTWSDLDTKAAIEQYFGDTDSAAASQEGWQTFLSRKIRECRSVQDLTACWSILCLLSNPYSTQPKTCSSCMPEHDTTTRVDDSVSAISDDVLLACQDTAFLETLPIKSRSTALSLAIAAVNHSSPSTILENFPLSGEGSARSILAFLNNSSRNVRIAAGLLMNAIILKHCSVKPNLSPHGHLQTYLDRLDKMLKTGTPAVKATTLSTIMQLAKRVQNQLVGPVLGLIVIALAQQGQLKALLTTQLDELMAYRKTGAYKLFSPHLEYLCTLLAENMGSSYHLLYAFVDILRLPVQAFLRSQGIARLFLAVAVDRAQANLIDLVSQMTETSVAELLILNADYIFAPLYFRPPTKFAECRDFFSSVLRRSGVDYTFQQILTSNLPALLLEIIIRAARDPECVRNGTFDTILSRVFTEIDKNTPAPVQLGRPLLTIFGRAGDLLRGMYGRKSASERSEILQGLGLLVKTVGASISGVTPQIMSILQLCFKDQLLRRQTLLLWQTLTTTLVLADAKPIFAQTSAAFVQAWPSLTETERKVVQSILTHCLQRPKKELGTAIYNIADLSGIEELKPLYSVVSDAVEQHSFEQQITGFLTRLDTFDETVQIQALRELVAFLKRHTAKIYSLASGSSFAPALGQLVHGLLQSSIRNAGSKSGARPLALRALGMVGALDPDRTTFPNEAAPFILQHDLREDNECIQFCLYTLEKVLVKALRSTNDPDQQNGLFVAIKGLAAVCGYDERSRKNHIFHTGVDTGTRERWNKLSPSAREIIDHLISTMIQVEQPPREELTYPLFTRASTYREWLQSWTSDLIHQLVNDQSQRFGNPRSAKAIFSPFRAAVRRGHDLTVALFVLPYLVFYIITSGNAKGTELIAKEIYTVLQDQITPLPSKMTSDSRSLCAQAVFELMDHLNTWIKSRYTYCQKKYRKSGKKVELEQALAPVRLIEQMFRTLPQDSVANAALNSKSFARALLNYEKILFTQRPSTDAMQLQPYYEKLHLIYAELNEPDGMVGVSASILSPSLQHQIREHEMTGRWTSAQSCWEVQLQLEPDSPESHIGLLRCLRNLGHYDSLRTHIAGLQTKTYDWQGLLMPYEIESALISGDMDALEKAVSGRALSCPEYAFAQVVLAWRNGDPAQMETSISQAAEMVGGGITTASKDSYNRVYDAVVDLHILHELSSLTNDLPAHASQRHSNRAETQALAPRLDLSAPTFRTRESILNMRRNILRLTSVDNDPNLGSLWLSTSKIAIKAGHLQTAYSAILQANQLHAGFTFVQSAKLYRANDQLYRALQEIEQGLNGLGLLNKHYAAPEHPDPAIRLIMAKAVLRSARWMQDTGRFDYNEVISRYQRAIKLDTSWEAGYYRLGQYSDDLLQAAAPYSHGSDSSLQKNATLLRDMENAVHYFAKALRYGTKFIYQALPRLLTIWLDLGAFDQVRQYEAKGKAAAPTTSNKKRTSGRPANDGQIAHETYSKIAAHIRRAQEKLPSYMWLSVLPQLASRVSHPFHLVTDMLAALIGKVLLDYPQQAIWTVVGQINSTVADRRRRIQIIVDRAKSIATRRTVVPGDRSLKLGDIERILQGFVKQLLHVANYDTQDLRVLSMKHHFPVLRGMLPCPIIMPFQSSMTVTLPTDPKTVMTHNPFPQELVTFKGFADEIEIMSSVAKPRKLVIEGSDGQYHRFLDKPQDDLRKDSRLLECTSLINRLLKKDAESRKRNLHIRTYTVIPLHESCGLIEWVPDTAGVRHLMIKCYEPKGIPAWSDELKKVYDGLKDQQKHADLSACGRAFSEKVLPKFPPVFHEWFLDNFPEPTAWLKARTAFGRTAAVMSMVGFVLGLGDRHGENILLDTTNGDVVHVDFNCLFGMGFVYFDIQEKVPFRLTQNIVDAFGITGVEGVFRRCCETTLRILRENKNSLLSVLESFIHDPLLELHLIRPSTSRKAFASLKGERAEDKAKREEEARKEEARGALQIMSNKLKGLQATTRGEPKETVTAVEMTVENLFKEATDPRNLGGMYCGWSAWM